MEEQDDIAQLFKSTFEGHKAPPGDASWEMLNHSLGTRNFFRFNAYQFNIYYASSILACLFICLGVGTHYTYKQWTEEKQEKVHVLPTAPVIEETANPATVDIEQNPAQSSKSRVKEQVASPSEIKTKNREEPMQAKEASAIRKTDSVKIVAHTPSHTVPSSHPKLEQQADSEGKPKRTLYITKRDTIFKVDTIKTHKKQKRWFK